MTDAAIHLDQIDPEAIAHWLQGHEDYRVLRRIKMQKHFQGEVQHPVKVVIVDTETTGLDTQNADLIEIGLIAVEVDQNTGAVGRVLGSHGGLEDPGVPIPPESTAIHGITDDMVKGQRFDENAVQALCRGADLFIAHNAGFDRPFIMRRFPWMSDTVWSCSFRELPLKQEGYASAKLESLLHECGYFHAAHRAVEDCNALLHFLAAPLKESQRLPFEILFETASESIYEIAALNAPFEKKDAMKAKGFRWNAGDRVWEFFALGFSEGKEVIEWLRQHVYHTENKIRLGFRIRAGGDRYAATEIRQQFKEV